MKKSTLAKTRIGHLSGQPTGINKRAVRQKIALLKAHLMRLETLELVITVVGTMKAGKSTCINAIVGREILPNRNRPMTSIPTLIRHKPGARIPVLRFVNTTPVNGVIRKLSSALRKASAVRLAKVASDSDLAKLSARICVGLTLKERYRGEAEINSFLQNLNDLIRLATIFNIQFPLDQFVQLEDFPMIEVEFLHLSQFDELGNRGSIALLDTPGFNEQGLSKQMRKMFKEQLQRSQAVLAVMDYTQLKSNAEAELIEELQAIAKHAQSRMFALVNKFDRRDANSDDAEATVNYVSKGLLKNIVPAERIFVVSARRALLAQSAQANLKPLDGLNWVARRRKDWRDDFGEEVFGPRYAEFMNDSAEISQASCKLWELSRFEAPLTNIIHFSQVSAVKFALSSSLDLCNSLSTWLDDED